MLLQNANCQHSPVRAHCLLYLRQTYYLVSFSGRRSLTSFRHFRHQWYQTIPDCFRCGPDAGFYASCCYQHSKLVENRLVVLEWRHLLSGCPVGPASLEYWLPGCCRSLPAWTRCRHQRVVVVGSSCCGSAGQCCLQSSHRTPVPTACNDSPSNACRGIGHWCRTYSWRHLADGTDWLVLTSRSLVVGGACTRGHVIDDGALWSVALSDVVQQADQSSVCPVIRASSSVEIARIQQLLHSTSNKTFFVINWTWS